MKESNTVSTDDMQASTLKLGGLLIGAALGAKVSNKIVGDDRGGISSFLAQTAGVILGLIGAKMMIKSLSKEHKKENNN